VSTGPALVDGATGAVVVVVVVGTIVAKLDAVTSTVEAELAGLLGEDEQPTIRHAPISSAAVRSLVAILVHPCPWQPRRRSLNDTPAPIDWSIVCADVAKS
jgi:hypothetical protein